MPLKAVASDSSDLPTSVKVGALFVVAYGLAVVISAAAQQTQDDWQSWQQFPRALVRCGGAVLVAYGLLRRARWAWLLAVVGGSVLLAIATVSAFLLLYGSDTQGVVVAISLLLGTVVALVLLLVGVASLLLPASRAVFRARAG